jgi:hypothetical protein
MMAAARSMRPGGFSCQTTTEDAAMIFGLSAFVNHGSGIAVTMLLPDVVVLA